MSKSLMEDSDLAWSESEETFPRELPDGQTDEGWSSVTHIAERIRQCRINSPCLALWLDGTSCGEISRAFVHTQERIVWNKCL